MSRPRDSKEETCPNPFPLNCRAVDRKDFRRVKALLPRSAEDRQAKPVRMDGNTVQLDEEMLAMNRNAHHEYQRRSRRNDQGAKQSDTRQGLIIKGDVSKT